MGFKFVDAQKMHKNHPRKFEIPSKEAIKDIKKGDFVKICNGKERFWVKVIGPGEKKYSFSGVIKNELIDPEKYNYGTKIEFRHRNIYQITKKDKMEFA